MLLDNDQAFWQGLADQVFEHYHCDCDESKLVVTVSTCQAGCHVDQVMAIVHDRECTAVKPYVVQAQRRHNHRNN